MIFQVMANFSKTKLLFILTALLLDKDSSFIKTTNDLRYLHVFQFQVFRQFGGFTNS